MGLAVALWIDDADYIDNRSEKALEYLLDMIERLGIRVTFKIAGAKARMLRDNRRFDLIERLKMHDICYHSDFHTKHPTVIEYTEGLNFTEGAAEFAKREMDGFRDVCEIFGRRVIGYGQPGEAWSPDVCPVMMKYGADVCLDEHFILNVEGQAFEYGGMLTFNGLHRIMRYDYHDEEGLNSANHYFDTLAEEDCGLGYPEVNKLFSVFYHPSEFYAAEYLSDFYNFREGKNVPFDEGGNFLGYILPPALPWEKAKHYIDLVGKYLEHMLHAGARFVTASDLQNMVIRRNCGIVYDDVCALAEQYSTGKISFFDIRGEYISPSEGFLLLQQFLAGKPLNTYLVYGPEFRKESQIVADVPVFRSEVLSAMNDFDFIYGYPKLKSMYVVGQHLLSPVDLCTTAAKMIAEGLEECMPVIGTLETEKYVQGNPCWDGRWLFSSKFDVSNTYEKTKLQCWTLKPVRY